MSHRIELPPELLALIEKREQADRRQANETPAEDSTTAAPELEDRRQAQRRAFEQHDEQPGT